MITAGLMLTSPQGVELRVIRVDGDDAHAPVLVEDADGQQTLFPLSHIKEWLPPVSGPSADLNLADTQPEPISEIQDIALRVIALQIETIETAPPGVMTADGATAGQWLIAKAIYDNDVTDIDGRGDVLPPEEWSVRDFDAPPLAEAHAEVRKLYLRRAAAVLVRQAAARDGA